MPTDHIDHHQRRFINDPGLRAGDSDRESVADLLREQHLAGRLDTEEFQERLDRCYAARTYAELDELVADLPQEEPAPRVRRGRRWPAVALIALLLAVVALSRGHLLWLAIPLLFFVVRGPLRFRTLRSSEGVMPGPAPRRSRCSGRHLARVH
jgi:hypothetical protein